MVPENPQDTTGSSIDIIPAGNGDEELKKMYDQMKTRVSEVPDYIRFLKTGSLLERRKAAEALGEIGDARAAGPLKRLLQDPKEDVRKEVKTALETLGVKNSS